MNDRFNIRYFNKNTRKFEYYKIGTVNTIPFTDCTVYEQGQFCTGLKDKNGKLIYEGDIIVIPNQYPFYDHKNKGVNYVGIVEWIYSQWQYVYHCVNPSIIGISEGMNNGLNDYGWNENENTGYLIIGNIYENKSLLESEG